MEPVLVWDESWERKCLSGWKLLWRSAMRRLREGIPLERPYT